MLAEFIVMFRESLEIAFVIGIILAYLHKTKNQSNEKHVWLGAAAGIVASLLVAYGFQFIRGGFEQNAPLFEGFFMVITSALVTWLVLWMAKQKKVVQNLQQEVKVALEKKETTALFLLAFTTIMREGVEAVLFMAGIYVDVGSISLLGGLAGIATAIILGVLVFEYAVKFNMEMFFKITTVVLVLLAAGLFSQGLHELQEVKILPTQIEHVYDLHIPEDTLMGERGIIGRPLKGLIGYDTDPSDLQVVGYFAYLIAVYGIYKKA